MCCSSILVSELCDSLRSDHSDVKTWSILPRSGDNCSRLGELMRIVGMEKDHRDRYRNGYSPNEGFYRPNKYSIWLESPFWFSPKYKGSQSWENNVPLNLHRVISRMKDVRGPKTLLLKYSNLWFLMTATLFSAFYVMDIFSQADGDSQFQMD